MCRDCSSIDCITDCSSIDCITDCVNEDLISLFDRLTPMSNHLKGKRKLVTGLFLNSNTTYTTKFLESMEKCRLKCPWDECESVLMVTLYGECESVLMVTLYGECESVLMVTLYGERSDWKDFALYQMLPNTASISIENHAKTVFIDYATFLLSCLGTWLGFSSLGFPFLGLNPFKAAWKKDHHVLNSIKQENLITQSPVNQSLIRQVNEIKLEVVKMKRTLSLDPRKKWIKKPEFIDSASDLNHSSAVQILFFKWDLAWTLLPTWPWDR